MGLAAISSDDLFFFGVILFFILLSLIAMFSFTLWMNKKETGISPYTGKPLRRGSDLHWMTVEQVLRYLYDLHEYENRMFDLNRAAICRDTGRIFPDCVTIYGTIELDWSFLEKRYPGNYVSWGSLTMEQQALIREKHETLEGYQTERSSSLPAPRKAEKEYIYLKPGPLYVEEQTGVLLGWKIVPGTELEVLIVQKPKRIYLPNLRDSFEEESHD